MMCRQMIPDKNVNPGHSNYRPDIDGLRALAVLAVVGFHAFPAKVPGGFIGVDVFFVISGFLISSILLAALQRDKFSLLEFYGRRIRRLFPALLTVMTACLALGWFRLFADEYRQLGKQIAGGAGFISNFLFYADHSYFDTAAATKPLLHLWSLAVEEQFYLFWPLALLFAWRRDWGLLRTTAAIAVLSFAANLYLVATDPVAAFYFPVARFWEPMIGAALACVNLHGPKLNSSYKNTQSAGGFTLLLLGFILIDYQRDFPGWWALLPALGAFFIISSGPDAWLNRRLLSNRALVWIGLVSYPIYLWHWPLLALLRIADSGVPDAISRVTVIGISIVLAGLTYRLIERPLRNAAPGKIPVLALLLAMAGVALAGGYAYQQDGLGNSVGRYGSGTGGRREFEQYFANIPDDRWIRVFEGQFRHDCNFYDLARATSGHPTNVPIAAIDATCYTPDGKHDRTVLIWGDSHAQMLTVGLQRTLPLNWQILQVASSGCVPNAHPDAAAMLEYCRKSNLFAVETIKNARPDVVIVAQLAGHSIAGWDATAVQLEALGVKRIVFTGPAPQWSADLPKIIARRFWGNPPRRTYVGINRNVLRDNEVLKTQMVATDSRVFVNLIDLFCNATGCLTFLGEDLAAGMTTWDYGHLTPAASEFLSNRLLVAAVTGQPLR
jgi:hypothetical protein